MLKSYKVADLIEHLQAVEKQKPGLEFRWLHKQDNYGFELQDIQYDSELNAVVGLISELEEDA